MEGRKRVAGNGDLVIYWSKFHEVRGYRSFVYHYGLILPTLCRILRTY